jgi:4'-phosphopantetheinyl transferase
VEVHCVALEQPDGVVARWSTLLSIDERQRAERFATDALRRRFIAAHAAVRLLLAERVGADPAALRFEAPSEVGVKPRLAADSPGGRVAFNLSHAGELALVAVAVAATETLGVDIEELRELPDRWDVAKIVFTGREIDAIRRAPLTSQGHDWYRTWTRKEAALKAIGRGFGVDARSVEMLAPAFTPVALARTLEEDLARTPWTVAEFEPAPGYWGALAVASEGARVRLARWPR